MTKKYRSKKSTTKKYKQKRGGEYETTREPVGPRDLEIAENLNKERLCDEAIAKYTPYFDKQDGSTVGSLTAKINMDIACKSKCKNKQNCQISLQKDDPNFFKKLHSESEGDAIYDPINKQYIRSHSPETMNELPVAVSQTENQLPQMKLTDNMFILPCLQEREQLSEMEQRGSIIREDAQKEIPEGNAIYYQFWHGKKQFSLLKDQRTSIDVPSLLEDMTPSKRTVLGMFGKLPTCRKYTTDQKWQMYGEWANSNLSNGGTVLLITHHNRLRGLSTGDSEGALLPIKDKKQCDSYANNFCFRIHYDGKKITTEIAFQGFPDKGGFDENKCDIKEGCKKKTGGGEKYTYCCPTKDGTNNIDTTLLEQGLKNAKIQPNTTFYVIRHGNAIHNKPMNIKDGTQLDSPLTPLGLYQAKTLGCFLKENYKDDFNEKDVILGTSLLCRTQLTGLAILNEIQGRVFNESNPNLFHDYNLLKQVSLNKFKAIANTKSKVSNLAIFNTFQPVSDNVSDFNTYCCSKLELDNYVPNDNNKPSSCISTAKGGKKKKQTRKIRRKKN